MSTSSFSLQEQVVWEKKRRMASTNPTSGTAILKIIRPKSSTNLQKKAKKARYEQEKETIRGAGCVVGEYVGDGHGDESKTLILELMTN